mmetsp:Transcript_27106/g.68913  ORF Transcript_27106/g.68913 Transcript_27106/m.68913 type:complete len:220 (-) Transcript_27106:685-1344(-)
MSCRKGGGWLAAAPELLLPPPPLRPQAPPPPTVAAAAALLALYADACAEGCDDADGPNSGDCSCCGEKYSVTDTRCCLFLLSSALYCVLCAQRSISRARMTGSGCDSARVCALRRYQPSRLLVASSYDRACLRNASTLSSLAKDGEPPASFMSAPITTRGSCATSSAARSHVSSAARSHRMSASSTMPVTTGSTDTVPEASTLATVSHSPWSHLRWPSS